MVVLANPYRKFWGGGGGGVGFLMRNPLGGGVGAVLYHVPYEIQVSRMQGLGWREERPVLSHQFKSP